MKQEIKDIVLNVLYSAPTSLFAWWHQASATTIIAVILGILQIAYLLRKWWREETALGRMMKRWTEPTRPTDLS